MPNLNLPLYLGPQLHILLTTDVENMSMLLRPITC